jgi:Holliday junction resolvasome RuvABC endonuclease subunit
VPNNFLIVGIDPGLDGAIAVLNQDGELISVHDAPVLTVKRAKGSKRVYLPTQMHAIASAITDAGRVRLCGIEHVHVMPKNGALSAFSLGMSLGLWEMNAVAHGWPVEWVDPAKWKRLMLQAGSGNDKQASVLRAQQICPASAQHLTLKKHDGRAEAILIAAYLQRGVQHGLAAPAQAQAPTRKRTRA